MEDEQTEGRLVLARGEFEHRDVSVRIAGGEHGPAADATPDPDRLLGTVVEVIGLGVVRDRPATVAARVPQRSRAPDHAIARNPVHLPADRPHEVATATRGDVVREPVRIEVPEQLDHRRIRALEIRAPKRRMLCGAQERV